MPYVTKPFDEFYQSLSLTEQSIIDHPQVQCVFNHGGYIAGGFVRQLLLKQSIKEYLEDNGKQAGDIDFWFPDENSYTNCHADLVSKKDAQTSKFEKSLLGFAINNVMRYTCFLEDGFTSKGYAKSQLISGVFGAPEKIMNSFDFTNVRCALTKDAVIYDKNFFDVESKHELDIRCANSPLLGNRILKYLNDRGLHKISDASKQYVTEWCIRQTMPEGFNNNPNPDLNKKVMISATQIKNLASRLDVISDEDLILLIGKYFVYPSKDDANYGAFVQHTDKNRQIDVALEEISRRAPK